MSYIREPYPAYPIENDGGRYFDFSNMTLPAVSGGVNDFQTLRRVFNRQSWRIGEITFIFDEYVHGLIITYIAEDGREHTVKHLPSAQTMFQLRGVSVRTLVLSPDERIISFILKTGAAVDAIQIKTNYGNELRVGGYGGNEPVELLGPRQHLAALYVERHHVFESLENVIGQISVSAANY